MYVPLDVNFPDDEKIEAVGLAGAGLYAMALCVAKRTCTDGRLTRVKLAKLGASDVLVDALITSDLIHADGPDHVQITAWLDHNESADEVADKRAADALRKRQARRKRPIGHTPDVRSESTRSPDVEVEVEVEVENTPSPVESVAPLALVVEPVRSAKAEGVSFAAFWEQYPRKVGKADAAKAHRKAISGPRRTDPDLILERLTRQRSVWARAGVDEQHTPHASTWLNGRRWEDDVLTAAAPTGKYATIDAGGYR